MRWSLKELMLVVTFVAVGCGALKYASPGLLWMLQGIAGLLLLGVLVAALVARGRRQAFAIGFVVGAVFYGLVMWLDGSERSGFWDGTFGTEQAEVALYGVILTQQWVDEATEEVVSAEDVNAPPGTTRITRRVPIPSPESPAEENPSERRDSGTPADVALRNRLSRLRVVFLDDPELAVLAERLAAVLRERKSGVAEVTGGDEADSVFKLLPNSQRIVQQAKQDPKEAERVIEEIDGVLDMLDRIQRARQIVQASARPRTRNVTYVRRDVPELGPFRSVCMCLWLLAFGYVGGHVGRYAYGRRSEEVRK